MKDRDDKKRRALNRSIILTGDTGVERRRSPRLHRSSRPSASDAAPSQYGWIPLDKRRKEIRLLDLDAGIGQSPLRGRLRHALLESVPKPEYETISYAWGNTALVDNCFVDDKSIPIPASAGAALRCMRSPIRTCTLWIDCICIDQSNDLEKGHQVGLIADIFQNSQRTIAHLGDDDDNAAERGFWGLRVISNAWLKTNYPEVIQDANCWAFEHSDIDNWSSLRETIDFVAVKAIMTKPYFE
jgi:hypothetical protein